MAVSGIEVASCILISLGALLTIITVALPLWKRNDPQDTVLDSIFRHQGLWIKCQTFQTGNWDCDDFDRFFIGLPTQLQVARAFGVTSILLGVASIVVMMLGMTCMPCGRDDYNTKKRIRMAAGIMTIISGFLLIVAVSWYANDIRVQHDIATATRFQTGGGVTRFIFGEALFVGWAASVFAILGGILALCTSCGDSDEEDTRGYVYRPPKDKSQEYV